MGANEMRDYLYNEYAAIKTSWNEALTELTAKIRELSEAKVAIAQLKSDLDLCRDSAILAETHKEGRINGGNEQTRKYQTSVFLATLIDEDPDYAALIEAAEQTQSDANTLQVDIDVLQLRISFLRNQAKMVAGLSYSLAGV